MNEPDPVLRDLARYEADEVDAHDFELIVERQEEILRARLKCCEQASDAPKAAMELACDIAADAWWEQDDPMLGAMTRILACIAIKATPSPYDTAHVRKWADDWLWDRAHYTARKVIDERDEP